MASKQIRPKTQHYGTIQRGASLTIPVFIKDQFDNPINLSNTEIAFTIKKMKADFDMTDDRAYVQKNFEPQKPTEGRFYIQLSSQDTNFEPGEFFFDIEITKLDGMVFRVCTLCFCFEGGPTNRTINPGIGQLPVGDEITILTLEQGAPIIVIAPAVGSSADVQSQIDALKEQVETQETQIQQLTEAVDGLAEKVEEIEDEIGNIGAVLDMINRTVI